MAADQAYRPHDCSFQLAGSGSIRSAVSQPSMTLCYRTNQPPISGSCHHSRIIARRASLQNPIASDKSHATLKYQNPPSGKGSGRHPAAPFNWARIRKTGAFVHYLGGQNVQTGADVPPTDQMFGCDAAAATPAAKQRPVRYFLTLSGRAFVTLQATKQRLHNCLIEGEWQSLLIHCPSGNG
jgi:hypothetical protein